MTGAEAKKNNSYKIGHHFSFLASFEKKRHASKFEI